MTVSDEEIGFAPPDFFWQEELQCNSVQNQEGILGKKHELPTLSALFGEENFAKVAMGWHSNGLYFQVQVEAPQIAVTYPDFASGDSIELFIDTRDVKAARSPGRFCHHFFFLPERFEGRDRGEVTRFRTEDSHPLCPEMSLDLQVKKSQKGYSMSLFIPRESLVGYDPSSFSRLGFTYRINRSDGTKQHFSLTSDLARIETLPHLWATLRLAP